MAAYIRAREYPLSFNYILGDLTQNEKEYRRSTERWENEGGHWLHILYREKMSDQEHCGDNQVEVIPTLVEQRYQSAIPGPTLFNSTYFMKLWNAGTRSTKLHRSSGRRNILSINADKQLPRIPSAEK